MIYDAKGFISPEIFKVHKLVNVNDRRKFTYTAQKN